MAPMMPVREGQERILDQIGAPVPPEVVPVTRALARVLAGDVAAPFDVPPADNSAVDGYAVSSADIPLAGRRELDVVGDLAAGAVFVDALRPGQALRIMTGAPMPAGADAVVPLEWTDGGIAQVRITRAPEPGGHIRRAGEDLTPGSVVLPTGTHLGATQIGLLAAVGRERVLARPRPRVVVLSTGSELVDPGTPLTTGKIPDSNSTLLTAAARCRARPRRRPPPRPRRACAR